MRAWVAAWCAVALAGARELDPATCAPRFDVQRDKIIRTEESRYMGARYISELDVGARHECLRLCCETDACDVFVYEEKSPGSCYLFACGPPEDFRCKFTSHGNFSSGVLTVSRHLAELQDQERLARHEQELANLRSATSAAPSTSTSAAGSAPLPPPRSAPPPAPPLAPPAAPPAAPRPSPPPQAPRRCSRYQFECHSGGECIAVYNACDGVPQCADGSDEAAELGCPAPAAPPAASPASPPSPLLRPAPPATFAATAPSPPAVSPLHSMETGGESSAEPEESAGARWPHRLAQEQLATHHRYNAGPAPSSHIFSHKGGLLQEPESALGLPQYPPFEPPWQPPRRAWPQPGYRDGPGAESGGWTGYVRPERPATDPRLGWPVPPLRFDQEPPAYMSVGDGGKPMPEVPVSYQGSTPRDVPKKGFNLQLERRPPALAPAPAPAPASAPAPDPPHPDNTTRKKALNTHMPVLSTDNDEHAAGTEGSGDKKTSGAASGGEAVSAAAVRGLKEAAHARLAADEHDGLSERPPAAVLLLVLGVAMTVTLAALAGCRARAARRRLRRGKSPLAHDADYLVNGMYL